MNHLELFSGTHSFGKVSSELGFNVISLDRDMGCENEGYISKHHIKEDILTWDYKMFPKDHFNVITASPPCVSFSTMGGGKHRLKKDMKPKTEIGREGDLCLEKVFEIIDYFNPSVYFIENPRGLMRHTKIIIDRKCFINECSYCKYGFPYMKNTDIFSNKNIILNKCFYKRKNIINDCHHETIAGSHKDRVRGGVQRVKRHQAYKIPPKLIKDLFSIYGNF